MTQHYLIPRKGGHRVPVTVQREQDGIHVFVRSKGLIDLGGLDSAVARISESGWFRRTNPLEEASMLSIYGSKVNLRGVRLHGINRIFVEGNVDLDGGLISDTSDVVVKGPDREYDNAGPYVAIMRGARFEGVGSLLLRQVDASGASFQRVAFKRDETFAPQHNLKQADLEEAVFTDCDVQGLDFRIAAVSPGTRIVRSCVHGARFWNGMSPALIDVNCHATYETPHLLKHGQHGGYMPEHQWNYGMVLKTCEAFNDWSCFDQSTS